MADEAVAPADEAQRVAERARAKAEAFATD